MDADVAAAVANGDTVDLECGVGCAFYAQHRFTVFPKAAKPCPILF
jgi:hypothetical protein